MREGLTTGFWPPAVGGGAPGGRSGWFPPGMAQLCMATGQQRLFLTGLVSVYGPGRMGVGPNSRPLRFLLAVPGGGGGMRFRVFWEASYLPWQNPGGLFALGSWGRGERGGCSAAPHPPAPSGVGLPSFVSDAPPWGILVLWGLPGGRGRQARPGQPPMGQCGGGGGGEGGSDLLALVRAAAFLRPASEGAAPFALSWTPPARRRWVACGAGACKRFTGGACRGRGAAPPPRAQRPPRVGAGPLSLRSASVLS